MDEAALLDAITASPDDDAPRQVYADWLMERSDPRGEYIALSCALARAAALDAPLPDEPHVIDRERTLLAEHHAGWTASLHAIAPEAGFSFRRGFVEHVVAYGARTFTRAICDALFEAAPLVRSLALSGGAQRTYEVADSWQRLHALELLEGGYLDDPIPTSTPLPQLRRLSIANTVFDADGLAMRLAATSRLEAFAFGVGINRDHADGDQVLAIVASSPALARVHALALANVPIQDLSPLAQLGAIRRLALQRCAITAPQLIALAPALRELATLELADDLEAPTGTWRIDDLLDAFPHLVHLRMRGMHVRLDASSTRLRRFELVDTTGIAPLVAGTRWQPHRDDRPPRVLDELVRRNKIAAIKLYREIDRTHHADAKMAVERMVETSGLGRMSFPFVMPKWT